MGLYSKLSTRWRSRVAQNRITIRQFSKNYNTVSKIKKNTKIAFLNARLVTCQKLAVGEGSGDFKLSIENNVTLPSNGNEFS